MTIPVHGARGSQAPQTLIELLRLNAAHVPARVAYQYLADGQDADAPTELTYAQLDARARAIAACLQQTTKPGDRALLLYPPGLEFIAAFCGCLYAGVVAVPAYPPRLNRPMPRLQSIVSDSQATVALTTGGILASLARRFEHAPELGALHWIDTDSLPADAEQAWKDPHTPAANLAFLQYTSGSTSAPKGVMVTHRNLMHNLAMIKDGFQIDHTSYGVFWLPSYHDMGLIGGILEPMYLCCPSLLMSPASFLQRPARWLETIARVGGNISGAPNFAYELCVEKVTGDQLEGLDLSRWRLAFCGAEPIRPETLDRFAAHFAPCGFKPEAFYPCYGLAEATLIVAGGHGPSRPTVLAVNRADLQRNVVGPALADDSRPPESNHQDQVLVSSGRTLLGQTIRIADPETFVERANDQVGEVWVAGDNVAAGYWNRPEATRSTFQARLAGIDEGPFLRTGDLGFLHDDRLYVTGRIKDLIIIRGRNHYPQDIEHTVDQCHRALRPESCAAFSVDDAGQERLVVVCEVERRYQKPDINEVAAAVRKAVALHHELQVYAIVLIKTLSIPKTSSGKIQRQAVKTHFLENHLDVVAEWRVGQAAEVGAPEVPAGYAPERRDPASSNAERIAAWLTTQIAARLSLPASEIDRQVPFIEYGLDSAQAVTLAGDLGAWLGQEVPPTLAWDYPTIELLSRSLATPTDPQGDAAPRERRDPAAPTSEPIAIVGLSCRFPGAPDAHAFWALLRDGVDAIQEVPADRWDAAALYDSQAGTPGKASTRYGGFLDRVDQFDPHFFGISPREAVRMDPQQRLLMEVAWEALENAGLPPASLAGTHGGVFVGISSYDYSRLQFEDLALVDAYAGTGNAHSIAANRLSYVLDLRGPSMAIDTACSSSLVAVHLACQSLRAGETALALAGGVNVILAPELTVAFSQARMLAPDGRCKTFDARADGYVRSEGCGVVVLKRLSDAQRDGDNVLAVIRGSAVNQDGRSNGITAPNGPAQQAVIRQALRQAQVDAGALSYVEAHGTGTPLGDPIEVQALAAVLGPPRSPAHQVRLGSVKTNIGHLEAAAGIAGLIKVILSLQNELLPPHLHVSELNPHLTLGGTPLQVTTVAHPWPRGDAPRLAGVSSFGFGGTNAHIVLAEGPVPAIQTAEPERPLHLLTLSARTPTALRETARRVAQHLQDHPAQALADVAFSANTGRQAFEHRLALTAANLPDAQAALLDFAAAKSNASISVGLANRARRPRIAFLFTGQGSQAPGMGRALYATQPVFRAALDRCAQILSQHGTLSSGLLAVMHPRAEDAASIHETANAQPALFALEYALLELWRAWGVEPDAVMGHSVGEYAAAVAAGVMGLEDTLILIAERGRLMQSLPAGGAMAAVLAPAEVVEPYIEPYRQLVSLAALNGPQNTVISGDGAAMAAILANMQAAGLSHQPLTVSHAFHSPLLEPVLDALQRAADKRSFAPARMPLISNISGQAHPEGFIPTGDYWRQHARAPVQFAAGMAALAQLDIDCFIEIGPHPVLLGMGRRCIDQPDARWLPSLRAGQDDWQVIASSLGAVYVHGAPVDWASFDAPYARRKLALPAYPFERSRYWFGNGVAGPRTPKAALHALGSEELRAALETLENAHPADLAALGVRLEHIAQDHTPAPHTPDRDPTGTVTPQQLTAMEPPARRSAVLSFLAHQTAGVLGLAPHDFDASQPINLMGLDSLMAVELKRKVETLLSVEVPLVALLQGPSVDELADLVLDLFQLPAESEAIPRLASDGAQPLTHNQQALWFLSQLAPAGIAFNVAGAVRIRGAFEPRALNLALNDLVARHPALRTRFALSDGQPVQIVEPVAVVGLVEHDAADWDEQQLQSSLSEAAHQPFMLEQAPLLRAVLLRRADDDCLLVLSLPHIITDFWSMTLLAHELIAGYQARLTGQPAVLEALPVDYADFVHWQSRRLAGGDGERAWDYWRRQLGGELPVLNLPTDRPRPAAPSYRGNSRAIRIDPHLASGLSALSRQHGATLFTTLLAAFQVLLYRCTGQEDLVVGSVTSGRGRPELARLIGYFVNPVALRANLAGQPAFTKFLEQARASVLAAFEHADFPPALLAERLKLPRDASRPPLFQAMFIMQKAQLLDDHGLSAFALGLPGAKLQLGDAAIESLPLVEQPAQFDLTLMMAEVDGGLAATLQYSTDLFDAATIDRMLERFSVLLAGIVSDPTQSVDALPLLTPADADLALNRWNNTHTDYPADLGLYHLFEKQARRTPESRAVSAAAPDLTNEGPSGSLTYARLDCEAGHLAARLQSLGVGPGVLVAVCMERGPRMLAALLAIHKAGAAYLPLDPAYPHARLAYMLTDSRAGLIVTQASLLDDLPPDHPPALAVDTGELRPALTPDAAPLPQVVDPGLAYVIYTSGSTGKPKGVCVPQRALVNFLVSMQREPGLSAADTFLAVTTLSFDIAALELFLPLTVGAHVVIAPRQLAADGEWLAEALQRHAVTAMQATPSTWRLLLAAGWQGHAGLKALVGGEALPTDLAAQLIQRCQEVWNMYGPTETTIWSTLHRLTAQDAAPGALIPIGRPIANTSVYVLDQRLQPVPPGVVGHLTIGGDGLALGYLGRQGLSAERFVPNPFAAGQHMYLTGDLARLRLDGRLEFLGRADQQVKLRGFRIELGEIEAALSDHPGIAQAAAIVAGRTVEHQRLAAVLVPAAGQPPATPEALRDFLRQRLPEYMLPAQFVFVEALPLTPNGKTDRRALAGLLEAEQPAVMKVAPRTPLERDLAVFCADILGLDGVDAVGVHDSFFDLGGHSLLATRLVMKLRENYAVPLPLRAIFEAPTIAGLAQAIEHYKHTASGANGTNGANGANGSHDRPARPKASPLFLQMSVEGLNAEVVLAASIGAHGAPFDPTAAPRRILLTGATGFVGAYLLRDLLYHTQADIYCLVRAADPDAALARIRRNMAAYDLWVDVNAGRIVPVPGDLAEPKLGLTPKEFDSLAQSIDWIYHNGALVNFVYPYREHKPVNVGGTQTILRLASTYRIKPVHFVSTLSVFHTPTHPGDRPLLERDSLDAIGAPYGGYAQSKWVSEKLVALAGQRGLPVAIYRPGSISGDSRTGVWNADDLTSSLLRVCLLMGAAPDLNVPADLVPVDYVSQAIVHLSRSPASFGQIFHLSNPRPLAYPRVIDWVRGHGFDLRLIPFEKWQAELLALAAAYPDSMNNPYLPLIEDVSLDQVFMPRFDCRNTLAGLAGSGVACPPLDGGLLDVYMRYFNDSGLLELPAALAGETNPSNRS